MNESKAPLLNVQIKSLFDKYDLDETETLLARRKYLNRCNLFLIYAFHLVQSGGILTTTVATGYNYTYLIWVGVGLNIFASLLNAYEKNNANILKKISKDIQDIRDGKPANATPMESLPKGPEAPSG